VDHKGRLLSQSAGFADCFFQRCERIRIRWLFKSNMAVGDLQEGEAARRLNNGRKSNDDWEAVSQYH
jgi:hypothetical protein